ncbi:PH domain-containing protein [Nocardiopsis salina]|uniref:PH domain-containing protein n=1 Tax=Nocardiopsis salina TaxID=245836 RepID=UPI0003498EFD|nr:PH domain-containing protein [Nocardiopsis salina]
MNHEYENPGPADPERERWARGPAGHTAGRYPYQWRQDQEPGPDPHSSTPSRRDGADGALSRDAAASERARWGPPERGAGSDAHAGPGQGQEPSDARSEHGTQGSHRDEHARRGWSGPAPGPAPSVESAPSGGGVERVPDERARDEWSYERARWGRPAEDGATAGVHHDPDSPSGPSAAQRPAYGAYQGHGQWQARGTQDAQGPWDQWSRWGGPCAAPDRGGGGAPAPSAPGPYGPEGHYHPPETREWWTEEASQPFTSESGRRLSPRSMVVGPINQLRSILLPILIGLVIGGFNPWLLAATGATVVMLLVGGFVTWQTLRYEITDDRIEIRKGLIRRERRTIPLERIRGVDVTSSLLHRMLGVSVVHIEAAAGSMATEDGKLDAVDAGEADRLRGELLRRRAVLTETEQDREGTEESGGTAAAEPETVVHFEMPRTWYLFGALSLAHLLTPFALLATAIGILQQSAAQMEVATDTVMGWIDATDRALLTTLAIGIPVALVLLMPVFAVVSYAVTNWGFTLKGREGSLVAERGLFTRRSVTLEKRRIRGHELQDNPLERTRSAVRLRAIVTGLGDAATRAVLLPTGPRPQVASVVERALARYDGGLRRHPRAALPRRLIRSVGPFLLTGAAGVVLDWNWLVIASAVLAVLGVPLGIDRYRSLGHGYDGAHVSVRSGSLQRGQAIVERSAVIGWTWTQTLFQRRSGIANLQVTVGAGAGGYTAQDASLPGSVAFAADVTPEMVRPFLVESGTSSPGSSSDGPGVTDAQDLRDPHDEESPRTADEDR